MRGRKPQNPIDQKARGLPGKRKSKVDKQIADAQALAEQLAAARNGEAVGVAPPMWLADRFPLELQVWNEFAPGLARLNILRENHRLIFAGFCVHYAQWLRATNALRDKGEVVRVKGTNGSWRERVSPWFDIQKNAWTKVVEMAERFGLDPASGYKLFREMKDSPIGGLFGDRKAAPETPTDDHAPAPDIAAFDSPPPGSLPN